MDSCGINMAGGFGMITLENEAGGPSSWGLRIICSIERGRVRVRESVVRCGFVCRGPVVFVHRWMAWWIAWIVAVLIWLAALE